MSCPICKRDGPTKTMEIKMKDLSGKSTAVFITACNKCATSRESFGCWFRFLGGVIGLLLIVAIIVFLSQDYSPATDTFCQRMPYMPQTVTYLCSVNPFEIIPTIIGMFICTALFGKLGEKIWLVWNKTKLDNHPEIRILLSKGWVLEEWK